MTGKEAPAKAGSRRNGRDVDMFRRVIVNDAP
jgi:hypothetical protein